MRNFLRNLFAALFGILTWPFRMMLGIGGGGGAAAQHEAEAQEADSRVAAVQAAVAPDTSLEDALAVRRAARVIMRGESAAGMGPDIVVRRWLHSLKPMHLAFVSRAQPEVLARVMAGESIDACPVPPFIRSEFDGSASIARLKSDLLDGRPVVSKPSEPQCMYELPVNEHVSAIIRNAMSIKP